MAGMPALNRYTVAGTGVQHGEVGTRYGATGQGPSVYLEDPEGNNIELKGWN